MPRDCAELRTYGDDIMGRTMRTAACLIVVLFYVKGSYGQRMAPTAADLQSFISVCPQNDPYYAIIRRDFAIRRNGLLIGDITCTEPYSALPLSQVTEEVVALQTLR